MVDILTYQGDSNYPLVFSIQDASGNASNISGLTGTLTVWNPLTGVFLINGSMIVDNAAAGVIEYDLLPNDLSVAGNYLGVVVLTGSANYRETTSFFTMAVIATTPQGFGLSRQTATVLHVP
jgi:hypothetical protein